MQHKIIRKLKSEAGSSLAFVIIIGVVILMLVASIMAIANSDFTFTQQSLESRQAYIDTKSVIEFGKIEINERMKWLKTENDTLNSLNQTRASLLSATEPDYQAISEIESRIRAEIDRIDQTMKATFYIDGDANSVATTVRTGTLENADTLGILTVTPAPVNKPAVGENFENVVYTFDIKTQNLRRELNYKVGISLKMLNNSEPIVEPTKPVISDDDFDQTKIQAKWDGNEKRNLIQCVIQKNGEQKGTYDDDGKTLTVNTPLLNLDIGMHNNQFSWIESRILDMTAKNIHVSTLMPTDHDNGGIFNFTAQASDGTYGDLVFEKKYEQNIQGPYPDGNQNKFRAKNVVFVGDLVIKDYSSLDISCENLYVTGNIIINDPSGTNVKLFVHGLNGPESTAKSIYVGGNVSVGSRSKLSLNANNMWLKGDVKTLSTEGVLEFKGFNYLETGNISLNDHATLTVTGADSESSQLKAKSITNATNNYCSLNIKMSGLWSVDCDDLKINGDSTLDLTSNIVKINKNFTIDEQVSGVLIKTQYFDCSGMTSIANIKSDQLYIHRISDTKPLYVRFAGGYQESDTLGQNKSFNIGEANQPATMVVFGKPTADTSVGAIIMNGGNGAGLNVWADSIYFDSNHIDLQNNIRFNYYGSQTNQKTNFYIRSHITFGDVSSGSYLGVSGQYPEGLTSPTDYEVPDFKSPPISYGGTGGNSGGSSGGSSGSSSGSGSIQEKYY